MGKIITIFLFAIISFSVSCKKYDDGGSKWTAGQKIIGKWKLIQFSVDGDDSLSVLDTIFSGVNGVFIDGLTNYRDEMTAGNEADAYESKISFIHARKELHFYSTGIQEREPFNIDDSKWKIKEITDQKIELTKDALNGRAYEIVLQKK